MVDSFNSKPFVYFKPKTCMYFERGHTMSIIFITGLSGVGKTSVLSRLEELGYNVLDTDYGYTKEIAVDESIEKVLDEDKILKWIEMNKNSHLFISGCYSNQGKLYKNFDNVVLLKADLKVMLDRIDKRTSNNYGKSFFEKADIIDSYSEILPLLEKSSKIIIDTTSIDIDKVCEKFISLLI
jgi:broad-specificity NMP kinase